jgi:hypothetical protein
MTLELRPEIAQGLETLASAQGLSVEDYLQRHVARELPPKMAEAAAENESGMVWEDGLFIYGAGTPLPLGFIDNALRLSREERSQHILGRRDGSDFSTALFFLFRPSINSTGIMIRARRHSVLHHGRTRIVR